MVVELDNGRYYVTTNQTDMSEEASFRASAKQLQHDYYATFNNFLVLFYFPYSSMPTYIPIHDRPPHYANFPSPPSTSGPPKSLRYSSPDIDPDTPLPRMSSAHESDPVEQVNASQPGNSVSRQGVRSQGAGQEEGHSRKRARTSPSHSGGNGSYIPRGRTEESLHSHHNGHSDAPSGQHDSGQVYRPRHGPVPLTGSIFNLSPRNPFTSVVGDFIMNAAMGHSNVEVSYTW